MVGIPAASKSHLVFFFNGKTAISIGRKKPRVAQVVIAKSAGLPDYHAHKKYLILCPDKYPTKSTPYLRIQQNTASKSGKNVIKTLKSLKVKIKGYKLI